MVEASMHGGPYRSFNLLHHYSAGLHYRPTVMFDADLPPGEHKLRLRVGADRQERSMGHTLRVLYFVAN
jgi:hypothetical protein